MYVIPHISNRILDFFWELPKWFLHDYIKISDTYTKILATEVSLIHT